LALSYSFLGEITSAGATVPDNTVPTTPVFHSVPLTDITIAAHIGFLLDEDTSEYAFVGYAGGIPQTYSTELSAFAVNLNFLAKADFAVSEFPVEFPNQESDTNICLRASYPNKTCIPFAVTAGTLKSAIALYNWTYAPTAAFWRIQYNLAVVGWTDVSVYFNGDVTNVPPFSGQVTDITFTSESAPFPFSAHYHVQQMFNKGDNSFGTATITSTGTASNLKLNVDIPLASLAQPSGLNGYWLYDPDVTYQTGEGAYSGGAGGGGGTTGTTSSSSITSPSFVVLSAVLAAALSHLMQ